MGVRDLINTRSGKSSPANGATPTGSVGRLVAERKARAVVPQSPVYNHPVVPENYFKPPVDETTGAEKAGTGSFKWIFSKTKEVFTGITDRLAETKYFKEAGEVLNTRDKYIREGTYDAGTMDFLGEALLENVSEVSKSVTGRGIANAIDTVIASPVNFATRAIYGESNPLGDYIAGFADEMRSSFETERSKAVGEQKFGKDKLKNWDFWLLSASEQIPTTLAFLKIAQVPYMATSGTLTKLLGTSKYAQIATQTISAGVSGLTMRGMESASEAEGTYKQAKAKGMSEEEALNASVQVFKDNMKLVGLDAVQAGLAFAPGLNRIGGSSVIGKILSETFKLGLGGASEGLEEVYQSQAGRRAMGEETSIMSPSPEDLEGGTLGFVMGVLFQGAGRIRERDEKLVREEHVNTVTQNLPPQYQTQIDPTATTAEKEAFLEKVAETDPKAIEDAVTNVEKAHAKRVASTKEIVDTVQNTPNGDEIRSMIESGLSREETALRLAEQNGMSSVSALDLVDGVIGGNVTSNTSFEEIDQTLLDKSVSEIKKEADASVKQQTNDITQIKKDIANIQKQLQDESVSTEDRVKLRTTLENKRTDLKKAQDVSETSVKKSASAIRTLVERSLTEAGITQNTEPIIEEAISQITSGKGKNTVRQVVSNLAEQARKSQAVKEQPEENESKKGQKKEKVDQSSEKKVDEAKKTAETKDKKEEGNDKKLEEDRAGLKNINPALFKKAEKATTVDEFIDAVVKADKTTRENVSIENLTEFFNRVKGIEVKAPDTFKLQKTDKKLSTAQDVLDFYKELYSADSEITLEKWLDANTNSDGRVFGNIKKEDVLKLQETPVQKKAESEQVKETSTPPDYMTIPDVVYHGTLADFKEFDSSKMGENTEWDNARFGFFFIGDKARAEKFVEDTRPTGDSRPVQVKEAKLNPLIKYADFTLGGLVTNKEQAPVVYKILSGEDATAEEALTFLDENIDLGTLGDLFDGLYGDVANRDLLIEAGYGGLVSEFGREDGKMIYEYVVFNTEDITVLDKTDVNTNNKGNENTNDSGGDNNGGETPSPVQAGDPEPTNGGGNDTVTPTVDTERLDTKRGRKSGKRPSPRQREQLSNEEIETALAEVATIGDNGAVSLVGDVTDEIVELASQYKPGGITKEGRGILDEYYTNSKIVDAIKSLFHFPAHALKVLEPAIGTGNFIYALPDIGTHNVTGFEINDTTARIAKILHPNATIFNRSFETEFIDDRGGKKEFAKDYDLVIGNPPYGEHRGKYKGLGEEPKLAKYEDYFVKRSLDVLKEGGIVAMVLPSSLLNRGVTGAELVEAYRLPNGVFEGTDIGTDIVVLRKDKTVKGTTNAETYFKNNPQNILGEEGVRTNRFGKDEAYVEGTLDDALLKLNQARQETEAIKILAHLNIQATQENIDTASEAVEEAGEGAEALVKAGKAETQTKKTIEKIKKTVAKTDKAVALTKHFGEISETELELWKKTQPDGSVLNPTTEEVETLNFMDGKYYLDFNYAQGDIYEKLKTLEHDYYARQAVSKPRYDAQKAKLEAVKPRPETIDDMRLTPNLDFVKEYVIGEEKLSEKFGTWLSTLPRTAFGDSSVWEVKEYMSNSQVRGTDKDFNEKVRVRRKRVADNLFAKFLKEGLEKEEQELFEEAYNSTYNFYHSPDYSKVPMFSEVYENFNGQQFTPNGAQKAGIGRLVNTGVGIIAHEVGFGKTITGVLTAHEFMSRGWAKRPLIVAPNDNVLAQWKKTIEELVPNAKVNSLGNLGGSFKGDLSTLTIEEGSMTLVTYEGFKRLSFNDQTYDDLSAKFQYLSDELDANKTERQKQKTKAQGEETGGKMKRGTRTDVSFETLGFDHLTFDEVHNANHIVSKVKLQKGEASEFNRFALRPSELGLKAWIASQYIQGNKDGRNVTLLSATPFTNHPLEYYSILSMVADKSLTKMGFHNVNEFFGTFMDAESEYEFKADGSYQKKTDIRGFKNYRQFRKLMETFIDFKQDIPDIDRPVRVQKTYEIPKTDFLREIEGKAQEIFKENEKEKGKGAKVLRAISELRKIAFSPYVSQFTDHVGAGDHKKFVEGSPKIDTVMRIVAQNKKDKPEAGQIIYSEVGIEAFPLIKDYLVKEVGYDAKEVEIITGATSRDKRLDIQERYNTGLVKVLLGSEAISEGMNLQFNTTDMHLLSLPWNFTALRQVIGRAWRQGNIWRNVRINQYFMQDSVDVFLSQKLDNKQKRYENSIKTNANEVDVGDVAFDELKFDLIQDPETRAKLELEAEKEQLSLVITQEKAELAFAVRKLEKVADIQTELTQNEEGLARELAKPADEQSDWWLKHYPDSIAKQKKALAEETQKLVDRGVTVESLLATKEKGEIKIKELEDKRSKLQDTFEERVKTIASTMPPRVDYTTDVADSFVAERAEDNKSFYEKKSAPRKETVTVEKAVKTSDVVKKAKKVVAKTKKTVTPSKNRDARIDSILLNGELTVPEKVSEILNTKQEGKKFKDVGERVSGSKKENSAIVTVLESGNIEVIAEMIKTLGAEAVANTLNKHDILEDAIVPNFETDQKNKVPAVIAGWKMKIYNMVARTPVITTKRSKWNYSQNVPTDAMDTFLTEYPELLRTFMEKLANVTTEADVEKFSDEYRNFLQDTRKEEETQRGRGVINIEVLGRGVEKVIRAEGGKVYRDIKEINDTKRVLDEGAFKETFEEDDWQARRPWVSVSSYGIGTSHYETEKEAKDALKTRKEEVAEKIESRRKYLVDDYKAHAPKKTARKEGVDTTHGNFKEIEKYERVGVPEKRLKAETLTKEMGFVSVQLGNYMDDKTAKSHIEQTILAVEDMSTVLGVDFPKLFNQKKLAIAYGARGSGTANAHYEPTHNIINLTKGRGDGSLFHELMHFMDWKHNTGGYREKWSSKKDRWYTTRPIEEATYRLMRALTGERIQKNKTFVPKDDNYILERPDHRLMVAYKEGKTLEDMLTEMKGSQAWEYQNLADVYRKSFTIDNLTVLNEPTEFYKGSLGIGGGSKTSYWVQPHELLARAGQAYIEDKMEEAGVKNSYITRTTKDSKAYPQGEERKIFATYFDKVFEVLKREYPLEKPTEPRFKAKEGVNAVVEGSYALPFLRDLKVRLMLDFDVRFVDTILTAGGGKRPRQEAWGSVMGNSVVLAREITRWTGQHEAGHLIFNNLERIPVFARHGITQEALIDEKIEQLRAQGINELKGASLVGRVGVKEKMIVEEQIMLDFEQYLEKKYEPEAGVIKRFFLLLKRTLIAFARAFSGQPNMVTEFYEIIDEGLAIDGEMVHLETDGILDEYLRSVRHGTLDYKATEKLYGGARFKIREEGDKLLQKLKVTYNDTESTLTKKQEELTKKGVELADTIDRKGRLAEVVDETPEAVREIKKYTTRKDPPTLTATGVAKLDTYEFESKEEAEKAVHEYVREKTELLETRSQLGKIRRQIATLKRGSKQDKAVLRDIERKLKARKSFLEKKKYYVEMGQGQGKKEQMKIIRRRGRVVSELQDLMGLSDARAKGLVKDILGDLGTQRIHLLSETAFDNFILRFSNEGADLANKLFEQDAVRAIIQEKQLQGEDNLRQAMKLPTITNMNAEQASLFAKALEEYELGDRFLTKRQLETIHRTDWVGVKTVREMHERIFADTGVSAQNLKEVEVSEFTKYKNWLVLSRSNPMFSWLVDKRFKAELQTQSEVVAFEEELNPVVEKARKSRKKSFVEAFKNAVAPMDAIVFGYIESAEKEEYRVKNDMTKEEVELAHFLMARLFLPAKQYMESQYAMNTRENYITHTRRGLAETFIDSLSDVDEAGNKIGVTGAVKKVISEIFSSQKEDEVRFGILGSETNKTVAFEKWFQFSLPRSGNLVPSKNVARASLAYAHAYFKKRAVDSFVPEALAMAKVQEQVTGYTKEGLAKNPRVMKFINEYLNDAKGRKIDYVTEQGSTIDNVLKIGIMVTAVKYLGFRPVLGIANFIGEFVGTMRATTAKEKWRGMVRSIQLNKTYRINQKHKYFTGRNPIVEIFDPQHEIPTRIKMSAMVLFSLASFFNNRFYIRAKMTEEEWQNEIAGDGHMIEIVKEVSKWRKTPFYITSLVGHTTVASMMNQFATWAIPVVTTTMSDLTETVKKVKKSGVKEGMTSEEAISLGKTLTYMGTLFAISLAIKAMDDDDDDRDVWFYVNRELNTLIGAFTVIINFEQRAPLYKQLIELKDLMVQLWTMERYKRDGVGYGIGDLKAWNSLEKLVTPTFVRSAIDLIAGEDEKANTKVRLIEEAVQSGDFKPEEIAEFINPDEWNNVNGERSEEKQVEYRTNKVYEITKEYNTRKKYPESKVAEILLTGDTNEHKVEEMIKYGQDVGKVEVFKELQTLYRDRSLCGNQERNTVCLVSDDMFTKARKALK